MATSTHPAPGPELLRDTVRSFKQYSAGLSIDDIAQRYGLKRVVKLASNENPLGASPLVQKALERAASSAFRYPRSGNPDLVRAIAGRIGAEPASVIVGNGSDELIDLLIRVLCEPGRDGVLACDPCFSMYTLQAKLCGVSVRRAPLKEDFSFDWDGLLAAATPEVKLVFLTTPDNPSGYAPPAAQVADFARALPATCVLAVDEAYMDFAPPLEAHSLMARLDEFPNVIILRTFSKLYGLAGLRLGYAAGPQWLIDHLWRVRPPFSVNIMAEEGGLAALKDEVFFHKTLEVTLAGRKLLTQELEGLGFEVAPSMANFILAKPGPEIPLDADALFQAMLERGVILRTMSSYGMGDRLRISIGSEDENRFFLETLQTVLRDGREARP